MAAPKLTAALTWATFENAILTVLRDALGRLSGVAQLPRAEEPINLELYWLMRQAHLDHTRAKAKGMMQFLILFDCNSQPEPDDAARAQRLRKRPDFNCAIMNPQAPDHRTSQVNYYIECKRLGEAEGAWVLNDNYSEHGVNRFVHADWQYAKGYSTATMVGYVQNSVPATILTEVNAGATTRNFPSLAIAATSWAARGVNTLIQSPLTRGFLPSPFALGHLWVDLCHCTFVATTQTPPAAATAPPPTPKAKPATPKKPAAKKTVVKKAAKNTAAKARPKKPR